MQPVYSSSIHAESYSLLMAFPSSNPVRHNINMSVTGSAWEDSKKLETLTGVII